MKKNLLAFLGMVIVSMPMAATAQLQSLVAGNTAFALNLYGELATNAGNLFSPPTASPHVWR